MKKIIILLLVTFLSGCSWLAILDTNPCEDKESSSRIRQETKILDLKYKNAGEDQIKNIFGKPSRVEKSGNMLIINDKECMENWEGVLHWGDCEVGKADEAWVYNYKKRTKCGWVFYSRTIIFLDGNVIEIR